jgi:hypothetical protein
MLRSCWKAKEGRRKKEEGRSSVKDLTDERRKKNYLTFFNSRFPIPDSQFPIPNYLLPITKKEEGRRKKEEAV